MTVQNRLKIAHLLIVSAIVLALGASGVAQTKAQGLIKSRNGDTILLQTSETTHVTVLLNDDTRVSRAEGVFKKHHGENSMTALIPGLRVKVEGEYNDQHQLVASSIKFKDSDLKRAQTIQAGLHESQEELKKQQAELQVQKAKIAANKAAIEAAVARFGQLDDYYILDEVTVYFGNGRTQIDPQYVPQLTTLADKARNVEGYLISVTGFASSPGSAALNQRLSEERADNVTNVLLQQAHVPLTRMLAQAAMGESHQIGPSKTPAGEAANRRVVVRVLQNKGIAGGL